MCTKLMRYYAVILVIFLLCLFSANVFAKDSEAVNEKGKITTMKLSVSSNGKSIVDQNGNEIARFVEGIRVITSEKNIDKKLPGCMRCTYDCIAYEGEKCVKWVRTCTWDFDCI